MCGGCDDSVNVCSPEIPAGRIQGRVKTGGVPVSGEVIATRFDERSDIRTHFRTEPDSTGYYAFDLPAGRFVVQLRLDSSSYTTYHYTSEGPGYGEIPPDTLLVDAGHSPSGIDFNLGGMTLDLQLSTHLDGEEGEVALHRRDADPNDQRPGYVLGRRATIENGRLRVDVAGILPGDYRVEIILGSRMYLCYCPYDGEHFWMPGTRDPEASPWYTINVDEAVHLEAAIATEPARIEGRISGAWLEMGLTPEPELAIFSPDSVEIMGSRAIESDGSFGVDIHLPGPVKLRVRQRGLEQWIGGPGFDDATVFDLNLGETIAGITLEQAGIHFVLGGTTGLGWSTEFQIYDGTGEFRLATMRYEGGSSYHLGVPNLWPGEFLVYLTPSWDSLGYFGWRPQWWDRAATRDQARPITLGAAGDIVRLDLVPETGGIIRGNFTGNAEPEYRYLIHAVPLADPEVEKTFRRSEFQGYEIAGLPEGEFKVGILPVNIDFEGPETQGFTWYPGTLNWEQAEILVIENANTITGIDFEIP